jgi:GT2 family glycosyltransferase
MVDVSVIIVNYNTKDITQQCIESIWKYTTGIEYEIILVDNASIDGSADAFSQDNRIIFVRSHTNLGFGKANNLALSYATGKYVFLLNSDTILLNNSIKLFVDAMLQMPLDIACLGTQLLAYDGVTENSSYSAFPSITNVWKSIWSMYLSPIRKNVPKSLNVDKKIPFEVDYVIGADLFIRRSVIEEQGLFDPRFFMYFEDSELQYRYSKAGYKMMIISGPKIIHLEGVSSLVKGKKSTFRKRKMYFESMFLFMRKRYSVLQYLIFRCLSWFYIPVVCGSKEGLNTIEKLKLSKMLLFGFYK